LHMLALVLTVGVQAPLAAASPARQPRWGAEQQTPPATQVQRPAAVPRKIYNETADAKAQIAAALKAAAEDDIRVLINWGANDDENCTKFQQAFYGGVPPVTPALQQIRQKLSVEYRLVTVDVGHLDKNQDLAQAYRTSLTAGALPYLTILDKNGKVLAQQSSRDFAAEPGGTAAFDPEKIVVFLAKYQAPAGSAEPLFTAALQNAKREDKMVFLWFSAPG
jgi:hypothetical protein